jgi:hypothetical protein
MACVSAWKEDIEEIQGGLCDAIDAAISHCSLMA